MGRSLAELLSSYLVEDDRVAAAHEQAPRRPATPEVRTVLETALRLAAAVAAESVVGIAYAPADGPTIVRLAGVRHIERSLELSDRLADDTSPGLVDVEAEHFVIRAGDRLRLGIDRGWELDAEQRQLLSGIALLASRAMARSGAGPLNAVARPASRPASIVLAGSMSGSVSGSNAANRDRNVEVA